MDEHADQMNKPRVKGRLFRALGRAGCLLAALVLLGGHWTMLQSFAWMRMLAQYSRDSSLSTAFVRTFDGRHPCPLCLQIQEGREKEQRDKENSPWVRIDPGQDLFCAELRPVSLPLPSMAANPHVPFVPLWHLDFIESPIKPPPRQAAAAS